MKILGRLGYLFISVGLGVAVGVASSVLLPVSIPVAISFGLGASATYLFGSLHGEVTHHFTAQEEMYENFREKKSNLAAQDEKAGECFGQFTEKQMEQMKNILKPQSDAISQVQSSMNTLNEKQDSMQMSVDASNTSIDLLLKDKSIEGSQARAMGQHGIFASANQGNFERANAPFVNKPVRKVLGV